jgi:DNA-binding SARP family transcriptional activator
VRAATELLEAGEYERLAELLSSARAACDQDRDAIPAQALDLARRICLACSQSHAEAEWHRQAREEAAQRGCQLRDQLDALLHLAGAEARNPAAADLPAWVESPSLWRRIQGILHRRPGSRIEEAVPAQSLEARPLLPQEPEPKTAPAPPVEGVIQDEPAPPPHEPKPEAAPAPAGEPAMREEPAVPSLIVYCLGQFRVYQDDRLTTDWPSGKGKSIFKYMIANRQRPVAKDVLMDQFWRGADPDAARNNLNVAIYGLRQALRAARPDFSHILFQDDRYLLNPSMAVWVDAEEFLAYCERGRRLEKEKGAVPAVAEYEVAEGLYQGDFLEEDLYEDWPMLQREGLRDSYLVILERLSRHYLESQRYAMCIHLCQKILAKDDCREDAHRRLMRCYCRQGQRNLALRQYHLCAETLQKELEVRPMAKTLALYERIRTGTAV